MKTKIFIIIFILFLLLTSVAAYLKLKENNQPIAIKTPNSIELDTAAELITTGPIKASPAKFENIITINDEEKNKQMLNIGASLEEKINVEITINGLRYEAAINQDSSAFDLMELLKAENKIDFSGKNYSDLGFFVEEINGVKNDPAGKNWIYYVNGLPAPVGVSNYIIKNHDIIEWKYEKKSF